MEFRLSRHAEDQMLIRDIPRAALDGVLQNPGQRLASGDRWIYQSKVVMDGRSFLLRVVVDERGQPFLVVTVYRTTKVAQYWEER